MARSDIAALAASFFAVLAACVGDGPAPNSVGGGLPDAGTAVVDAGDTRSDSGGPTCPGDTFEACGDACTRCSGPVDGHAECKNRQCQKVCDAGKVLCGNTCVQTATSGEHCGACEHSCEGAQCVAGTCQPLVVASGLTDTHAIDVSATSGVVISAGQAIVRCDVPTGCTSATLTPVATGFDSLGDVVVSGSELYFVSGFGDFSRIAKCLLPTGCPPPAAIDGNVVDSIVNDPISRVVVGPNRLVWSARGSSGPFIKACDLPGCANPSTIRPEQASATQTTSDTTNPVLALGASSTRVLYGSAVYGVGGVSVRSCAFPSCVNPTDVGVGTGGEAVAISFFGTKFYFASREGASDAVWSVGDGATTKTSVGSDVAGITDLAVDSSGVYWTNGTTGKVLKCDLGGCGGGTELASGQAGVSRIRVDSKFVYWMTPTAVLRVVK